MPLASLEKKSNWALGRRAALSLSFPKIVLTWKTLMWEVKCKRISEIVIN